MLNTNYKKIALIVLDGWGIGLKNSNNPLYVAKLPNLERIKSYFPYFGLQASGLAVGLPWNEEGNSEIGHLTISAGRIVYQNVALIDSSINDGSFFKNPVLLKSFNLAKEKKSAICFAGLLGTGITHSSFSHLLALIKMAEGLEVNYKLHLFTDGRDSYQKECLNLIKYLPEQKIGSISGRFYAMDRDRHIDRTLASFKIMTSGEPIDCSPSEYLRQNYEKGITDEFVRPASFNKELSIQPDDSVVFFNFRRDRMRQIARVFQENLPQTDIFSFTEYEPSLKIQAAFKLENITNPLTKIISDCGITQIRIAESEKQAHATYFLNGEREDPYPNEFRVIIPSNKTARHDKYPEMMVNEITTRAVSAMEEGLYGFIFVNYANPDMIAHTGNFDATVKAAEIVDKNLGLILDIALKTETTLIITADHGNAEKLIDENTGEKDTKHNSSPVPFIVVDRRLAKKKTPEEINENENMIIGSICDVAPTILKIMNIQKPPEMTGQDLTVYF